MKMTMKRWMFDKISAEARRYNTWIDVAEYFDNYYVNRSNDTVVASVAEILKETEKAYQVRFNSGMIGDGSTKGWTAWVAKSQIVA